MLANSRANENTLVHLGVVCSCVSNDHARNSQAGLTSEDILTDVGLGPSCHSGGAEGSLGVTGGAGEGTGALAYTYRA